MSNDWVVGNLQNSINTWNSKLTEIWNLLLQAPETFKGGRIWEIITNIYDTLQVIGLALLLVFFAMGVVKNFNNFNEIKRPEQAVKLLVRFCLAQAVITYGMDLMLKIFERVQGIIEKIMESSGIGQMTLTTLPPELINAVESCNFFEKIPLWTVTIIGGLFITILSFIMILSVYGRFFRIYMYVALAPVALSTFAGEPTSYVGKSFLKSFCSVCLEGAIIVIACIIFSAFASAPPVIDITASAVNQVWSYIGEIVFNMLVLVGTIKMSDRVVKEFMGI